MQNRGSRFEILACEAFNPMFKIELKFKIADREVCWEKFATSFLAEAFRSLQNELQPKPTSVPCHCRLFSRGRSKNGGLKHLVPLASRRLQDCLALARIP